MPLFIFHFMMMLRRELIDDVGRYDGHLFFLALDPVDAFVHFPFYLRNADSLYFDAGCLSLNGNPLYAKVGC